MLNIIRSRTANGVRTYNSPNPITLAAVDAVGKAGGATGTTTSTGSGVLASDTSQPLTRDYNFTIDQELPWKTRLDVGYVGSRTINQPLEGNAPVSLQDLNVIPLGGAFAGGKCANPPCNVGTIPASVYPLGAQYGINAVNVLQHRGKSNYNGLQLSWLKQTGRINYNLNYTWSKALGTLGTGQLNGLTPDATNINNDYGVLSIDRSHVFNFSYTFQSGNPVRGNAFLRGVANGWNISGISTWQSGPNLNSIVTTNFNIGGTGPDDPTAVDKNGLPSPGHGIGISNANYIGTLNINLQPTLTCDPTSNLGPHQYVNGSCFGIPNGGTNGPYHYPYIHGPAYFNSDLAVFKSFKITEAQSFELRLSAFNFLNHPLWSFNPNQHGDLSLNYKYSCTTFSSVTNAKGTVGGFCLNGNGSYAQTNPIFGVAQNQYGRRVAEISLKYKF